MYFNMHSLKKITFHAFVNAFFKENKQKEKFMHCRAFNIHLSTTKIKLHANQQKILLLKEGLNVVSPHFTIWVLKHYPEIYSKFTTLSSQYKVTSIQNLRPSRLSTRSKWKKTTLSSQYKVKMKKKDPLVSVQGQNEKKMTLSSQYEVTSIQNLRPSRLSTRSK